MIQRIQSVWLFLASVVIFSLFLFPFLQYADATGAGYAFKVTGKFGNVEGLPTRLEADWLRAIVTLLIGLLPLYTIFLFKNRKQQIQFSYLTILLVILLGAWFAWIISRTLQAEQLTFAMQYIGVGLFLIPVAVIFLLMAISAIRKDEKLIRSADRLR